MADRRRRRKLGGDEDSEAGSDASEEEQNGVRRTAAGSDGGDSEYESADEEELVEEEEEEDEEEDIIITSDGVPIDKDKQLDDDEDRKNPQYIPKKGTFYEHDDRTAATEEDTKEQPKEPVTKKEVTKKKVWKEDDRWNHDRFNEYDQAPKSREELIAVYGYDIRNEEGPPRARRRRRYGRGPNKYTRNWEDLDAYSKPTRGGGTLGLRGRGGGLRSLTGSRKTLESEEEFPALGSTQPPLKDSSEDLTSRPNSQEQHWVSSDISHGGEGDHPMKHQHQQSPPHSQLPQRQHQQHHQQQTPPTQQPPPQYPSHRSPGMSPQSQDLRNEGYGGRGKGPRGRGRGRSYAKDQYRNSDDRSSYSHTEGRQGGRGMRGGYQQRPQPPNPQNQQQHQHQQQQEQHAAREVEDVMVDMKNMSIASQNREETYRGKNRGGNSGGSGLDNRRNNMPPRLQQDSGVAANLAGRGGRGGNASPAGDGASSRPKRYSSQRQRSIPEQAVPPYPQQHGYLDAPVDSGYQGGVSDASIVTSTNHNVTVPHTQLPLAGGAPPSFVPPAFTTSPSTYPPEPFLGSPPAPRMFPPVTQAPHLFGPPVAPPVPVPGTPVAGPPPVAGPLGAPPVGAPTVPGPPVTGPPFLPPENMINFGAHPGPLPGAHPGPLPGAAPHPPQFPPFQGYTPGPVSQPGEIYSNGVTYYNTESQQQLPRANLPLQKRPKAAIPIVPPPERERRRREARQDRAGLELEQGGTTEPQSTLQDDPEDSLIEGESVEDSYECPPQYAVYHQQQEVQQPQQEEMQQPQQQQQQEEMQQAQQQQQQEEIQQPQQQQLQEEMQQQLQEEMQQQQQEEMQQQQQEEMQQQQQEEMQQQQQEEMPQQQQQQEEMHQPQQQQQQEEMHQPQQHQQQELHEQQEKLQQQQHQDQMKQEQQPQEEQQEEKLEQQKQQQQEEKPQLQKEEDAKETTSTDSVSEVTVVPQDVDASVAVKDEAAVGQEAIAAPGDVEAAAPEQPTEAVAAAS